MDCGHLEIASGYSGYVGMDSRYLEIDPWYLEMESGYMKMDSGHLGINLYTWRLKEPGYGS